MSRENNRNGAIFIFKHLRLQYFWLTPPPPNPNPNPQPPPPTPPPLLTGPSPYRNKPIRVSDYAML